MRWSAEEIFQAGKGLAGLDEHQGRTWTSWYRWVTLAMLALAFLTVAHDRLRSPGTAAQFTHASGRARGPGPPRVIDTARMAELRPAQTEDVSAIMAIAPGHLGSPGQIQALIQQHASLVAVEHGEIAGFLVLKPGHFYQRDFIDLLFVAPRWRRHGIGRALMRAALQNASTSRVFVSTNESNTAMRELLRSEAWSPSGVLTGLDEGDPEHVFFHDVTPG